MPKRNSDVCPIFFTGVWFFKNPTPLIRLVFFTQEIKSLHIMLPSCNIINYRHMKLICLHNSCKNHAQQKNVFLINFEKESCIFIITAWHIQRLSDVSIQVWAPKLWAQIKEKLMQNNISSWSYLQCKCIYKFSCI